MKMENKQGISFRISAFLALIILVMGAALIQVSYRILDRQYINNCSRTIQQVVGLAAEMVDGDRVADYVATGVTDDAYEELQLQFNRIKENMDGVKYLYLFVPGDTSFTYVLEAFDQEDDWKNLAQLGDVYEYGNMEYQYLVPDIQNRRASTELIYGEDVGYGRSVTAWAPVLDSQGNLAAMVEADYMMESIQQNVRRYLIRVSWFLGAFLLLVFLLVLFTLRQQITRPLTRLMQYVDSYEDGQFQKEFDYPKKDEIRRLADSFGLMDQRIHDYIERLTEVTAEKERVSAELDTARTIQASMLPNTFPPFPDRKEFDLYAMMTPAKEVGGDFYDFFLVDDDHLAMVIADVSGKGIPAALFMVITKTLLKNRAQLGESPKQILETVNNQLCEGNEAEMFVTVWLAIYEISTGRLTAANAGHEYPAICRKGGQFELYKDPHGFVLAAMEDMLHKEYELQLEPGDVLMVYTDGVPEATDEEEQLYTTDRMLQALNREKSRDPEILLKGLKQDIDAFDGNAPQFDDITMLCFKVNERPENV
jgi:sigma-B regulation protein RsbU (phosphoserine phosphatase)